MLSLRLLFFVLAMGEKGIVLIMGFVIKRILAMSIVQGGAILCCSVAKGRLAMRLVGGI